jgi:hypothetical protein
MIHSSSSRGGETPLSFEIVRQNLVSTMSEERFDVGLLRVRRLGRNMQGMRDPK